MITRNFKPYNTIGKEEIKAVQKVMRTGVLSKFLGSSGKDFYGGPQVQKFEKSIKKYFKVKYAITVNSWTSGLICCVGALDISPGDEIIVTTWSMCASATAILHLNCIPVFADINPDTYNIDVNSIEKKITKKTKAIMTVDIFGQSCEILKIMKIAKEYNLKVISDSAQSIGTKVGKYYSGTLADIGGYSLNYHKHINTGEGGIVVTNNKKLYERVCLIRNHGEAVINKNSNAKQLSNVIGYNFRLGEIESAIGIEQLKKLNSLIIKRQNIAKILNTGLSNLPHLKIPKVLKENTHSYYIYPMNIDVKKIGVSRKKIVNKLKKSGVPGLAEGYVNIHKLPMYKKKIAYGINNFPWKSVFNKKIYNYNKEKLPIAEEMHKKKFFAIELCLYDLNERDTNYIVNCFKKVWKMLKIK
jgi:dTDP-4-amino-4,6-dideoxygalactose transaminase